MAEQRVCDVVEPAPWTIETCVSGALQGNPFWSNLKWGMAVGGEKFAESMRRKTEVVQETRGRRALNREVEWKEVVKAVETEKGEWWDAFVDRHGDWGRDLALWIAR